MIETEMVPMLEAIDADPLLLIPIEEAWERIETHMIKPRRLQAIVDETPRRSL